MSESIKTSPSGGKWHFELIIVFLFFTIIGIVPWEHIFFIQIRNDVLIWFTSFSMSLVGLIGLSSTLIIDLKRNKTRFSTLLIISLSFIVLISGLLLITTFVLPTFEWKDKDVYRNGNDYLVIQEQEAFVTSNLTYPRIVRTPSPYGIIRLIEEQSQLTADDEHFEGDKIVYKGKTWFKVLTKPK